MECSPDVPGIPPGFPVSVRAAKALIAGHPADLLVSAYTDATVLFVNQLGSAGTVLQARQDSTLEGRSTFSISVLVGRRDEPLLLIAARQLVEIAAAGSTKIPLICCLSLKSHSPEAVKEMLAVVQEHKLL